MQIFGSESWCLSDIISVGDQGICVRASPANLLLPWEHTNHFQEGMSAEKQDGICDLQLLPKKHETALEPKQSHGLYHEFCRGHRSLGDGDTRVGVQGTLRPSPHSCAIWDAHLMLPLSSDLWAPSPVGLNSSCTPTRSGQLVTRTGKREGQGWSSAFLGGLAPLQPSQGDSGMATDPEGCPDLQCLFHSLLQAPLWQCAQHKQQSCLSLLHRKGFSFYFKAPPLKT